MGFYSKKGSKMRFQIIFVWEVKWDLVLYISVDTGPCDNAGS